jgi:hypothetical protein
MLKFAPVFGCSVAAVWDVDCRQFLKHPVGCYILGSVYQLLVSIYPCYVGFLKANEEIFRSQSHYSENREWRLKRVEIGFRLRQFYLTISVRQSLMIPSYLCRMLRLEPSLVIDLGPWPLSVE